ncbi:transcription termination/antitermination protein NusG [Mesorhizobium sp. M0578]|uniref:transcription termination/antitermination protein NusG n=1 Tax=unclassified Mesorhizobium TaxID=325217 RepID=UPI00333CA82D
MMHSKRPSDVERAWLDRQGEAINVDRAYAESDRMMAVSRRQQALLAGAGESVPEARWFVLRLANHAEKDVDKLLGQAAIERWFPLVKKVRNAPHAKRKVVYTVPALPGYVFIRVVNDDRIWAGLLGMEGVVGVLGGSLGPVAVSDEKRLKFKKKLEERSTDAEVVEAAFPVGASVLIEEGPFASFPGTIQSVLDEQYATVLVEIFGRFVPVDLSLAQITKSE